METSRLCLSPSRISSPLLPPLPSKTQRFGGKKRSAARSLTVVKGSSSSSSSEWWSSSRPSVDESMIVLRKRIHQMKTMERNYEPPEEWWEWEKQHYASRDEYVCAFVGALQAALMRARPSLALAIIAVVAGSVPVSAFAVAMRLLEVANGAFSSLHLG